MRRYNEELLAQLYLYVMKYQKMNGRAPTYRTVQREMPNDFSSTAKIKGYLEVLKQRGKLETTSRGAIRTDDRLCTKWVNVLLVGCVACGQPIDAIENIEGSYALPDGVFGHGELMMLRAQGESMRNVGIDDGDLIVFRRQETAEYGDKVLALIGNEATVKTYRPQPDGTILLHPENEEFQDILVHDCMIQGKVVGCIKVY